MSDCSHLPEKDPWYRMMLEDARRDGIPISGTFELTPRCSFNCRMCYVHLSEKDMAKEGQELSSREWIRIAEEAREAGMLFLCITGGEPTLHPEFETIYRALAEMGFFITLQINAANLTEPILRLLEEYPPQTVKITIYGSNDEEYEAVCGIPKGFTKTNAGVQALKTLGIHMEFVTTVVKANKAALPAIHRYARETGAFWYYSSAAYPSLRGAKTNARAAAIEEADATDYRREMRSLLEKPPHFRDQKPCSCCRGYRVSFWVFWNGQMNFCSFLNEPGISVKGREFAAAWKELLDFEEALTWHEACQSCEVKDNCPDCIGKHACYSGGLKKTDQDRCEKYKRYFREEKEN